MVDGEWAVVRLAHASSSVLASAAKTFVCYDTGRRDNVVRTRGKALGFKIGNLERENPLVPKLRTLNNLFGLGTELIQRNEEVNIKEDRSDQVRAAAGPVLECFFQKISDGNNQTPRT
jgi:hypothetical protein